MIILSRGVPTMGCRGPFTGVAMVDEKSPEQTWFRRAREIYEYATQFL